MSFGPRCWNLRASFADEEIRVQSGDGIYPQCTGAPDSDHCNIFTLMHLLLNIHCLFFLPCLFACFQFYPAGWFDGSRELSLFLHEKVHCPLESTTNSQGRQPRVTSLQSVPEIKEQVLMSYQRGLVGRQVQARGALNVGRELHSLHFYTITFKFM